MTIQDNILAVQARAEGDEDFANMLKDLAIKAVYNGFGSEQWNQYMDHFADPRTPAQLARLTTTDGDHILYVKESRAYLVGNGVCLPGTTTGLPNGIGHMLDQTL